MAITFWSFHPLHGLGGGPLRATAQRRRCLYPRVPCGEWNFLAGGRMHLIILLILVVALAAIIIWLADWTSGPRLS